MKEKPNSLHFFPEESPPAIAKIRNRVRGYRPTWVERHNLKDSAVCAIIIKKDDPELIFTLRASDLTTHAGQVCFPGGMREKEDKNLLITALRETEEEIGLAPHKIEVLGGLTPVVSHHGIWVRPFVGLIDDALTFEKNHDEVASIFSVPLSYLKNAPQQTYHNTPCYHYRDYKIWGLTGQMVKELTQIIL
ncbi:CoA pyrophosphatase [Ignatzschineria sp. RMDPL8A]|uniref:CoA pyrophosphatase n=1 Tax=Ignatzschineria sp. RMDPL8A TaxID=2999236 RepID=UPI0016ABBF9E|nr:CoA pyrophosphatase [Ignatzschineria sp. RMDPL8A]MDG9729475.1 CoA pyrophosphatase [Ignatzschineria sp. RMDPL8A]NLD08005.1 CoA pyrophosphatase [Xanthomonadaceae bacterium]